MDSREKINFKVIINLKKLYLKTYFFFNIFDQGLQPKYRVRFLQVMFQI